MPFMIGLVSSRFRTTTLDAIQEIPVVGDTLRWKPVRRTLDIRAFGTNAYVADADQLVVEEHDERSGTGPGGHEELYLVVRGHARFTIDGEDVDAPAGTLIFLPEPEAVRVATALEDGTLVMAFGGRAGEPYEVSPWEPRFAITGLARAGCLEEALAELRRAYAADPERVAAWAREDEDLAPLRTMDGYPPIGD
jgi:AraC-like ligand binding domain